MSYGSMLLGTDLVVGLPRTVLARDPAMAHVLDAITVGGAALDTDSPLATRVRELMIPSDSVSAAGCSEHGVSKGPIPQQALVLLPQLF